ncbi:hypothetical protein DRN76_03025 [Methanosarcinales archaeon]|nr:MAG: hypothetical protein DRN76_03025 [Methanosarcinales archaeon]
MELWQNFRKKPIVIRAFKFDMEEARKIALDYFKHHFSKMFEDGKSNEFIFDLNGCPLITWFNGFKIMRHFEIETLEGNHHVSDGDWIIRGIAGEFYPCKAEIFEKTYEKVL